MKDELHRDIANIAGSLVIAFLSKLFQTAGTYTVFATLNLISLLYFIKSVMNFIEHKYNIKILKLPNKKTVRE